MATIEITVSILADGTPDCTPQVTHVHAGDTLVWKGKAHSGEFVGIFPGPLPPNPTHADLAKIKPQPGPMPFTPPHWSIVDENPNAPNQNKVQVDANAKPGIMYKYTIHAAGKPLDPIVIVDDGLSD